MEQVVFHTADFEGPLDLLLYLINKHKMKLYDIRIMELIDQYLAALGEMDSQELESASEFIEMAARLIYLKSVALLPRSEEREQLERELTGELVEYSLCKQAARKLRDMQQGLLLFVREQQTAELDPTYTRRHEACELAAACEAAALKGARRAAPDPQGIIDKVMTASVPVTARVIYLLRGLRAHTISGIRDMFIGSHSTSEAVATFLGLLELIRAGRVKIDDDGGAVLCEKERKLADG